MTTFTTPVTTTTIHHAGVLVSPSGNIKIAQTPRKFWRIWIYNEQLDVWLQQSAIFKKSELTLAQKHAEQLEIILAAA